jgi:hypothetical protein
VEVVFVLTNDVPYCLCPILFLFVSGGDHELVEILFI